MIRERPSLAFVLAFLLGLAAAIGLRAARAASPESANPLGTSQPNCYLLDRQTAAYRTVTVADGALGAAASSSIDDLTLDGRQTLSLSCRFTSSSGTATIEVCYYYRTSAGVYTTLHAERYDLAAGPIREQAASGRYLHDGPRLLLDSAAANRIEIRVITLGGAESSLTIWPGTY